MLEPISYGGSWVKLRHKWKKNLLSSDSVSKPAKLTATVICDTWANKNSACFWPSNNTIADHLGHNKRTVQRHLVQLQEAGFIQRVSMKRRRRAFQLVFPFAIQDDTQNDSCVTTRVTKSVAKGDSADTHYKEPHRETKNERPAFKKHQNFPKIAVAETDDGLIEVWSTWIHEHTGHEPLELFERLRDGTHYLLPSRFPPTTDEDVERVVSYFAQVYHTNGYFLMRATPARN